MENEKENIVTYVVENSWCYLDDTIDRNTKHELKEKNILIELGKEDRSDKMIIKEEKLFELEKLGFILKEKKLKQLKDYNVVEGIYKIEGCDLFFILFEKINTLIKENPNLNILLEHKRSDWMNKLIINQVLFPSKSDSIERILNSSENLFEQEKAIFYTEIKDDFFKFFYSEKSLLEFIELEEQKIINKINELKKQESEGE